MTYFAASYYKEPDSVATLPLTCTLSLFPPPPPDPGIVFYYILLQLLLWWFFHVLAVFWKIEFPLHAKRAESAHLIRYVHLTMVVLGLILPLVPVIATLATTGFGLIRFPAILCGGRSANATFYALVLPIVLLLQVGITLLGVMFWTIHKVCFCYEQFL